ncbi:MAG: hypothetical protein IT430_18840 [Phycisphaerales bacterium]|nr:hypothetical protein [Phycisphaerales bacterium]
MPSQSSVNAEAAESLALAKARMRWALSRIGEFEFNVDEFLKGEPFYIRNELEPAGRDPVEDVELTRISYRFQVRRDAPIDLRFMAADAVHNLRSAADNLVWACGRLHGASERICLPFAPNATSFRQNGARTIKRLPPELQQWIERQQIFNCPAGDPALLYRLNGLWNQDKHRLPTLLGAAVRRMGVGIRGSMLVRCLGTNDLTGLRDGDEIAFLIAGPDGVANFEPSFDLDVAFDAPYRTGPKTARHFLRATHRHIAEEMVPVFEKFMV